MPKFTTYLLLIISTFLLTGCFHKKTPATDENQPPAATATPTPQETQLPPEERPIITMTPDAQLRNVKLAIENLPEDVTTVDYEFVYAAEGDLQRGVIGTYSVSKGTANILLGSCSSGTCKYDKGVHDGQLTIKYRTNGQRVLLRELLII